MAQNMAFEKQPLKSFVRPRRKKGEDRVFQKLHDLKLSVQDDRLSASFSHLQTLLKDNKGTRHRLTSNSGKQSEGP